MMMMMMMMMMIPSNPASIAYCRSIGCIFTEIFTRRPMFPGKTEIEMINKYDTPLHVLSSPYHSEKARF